LGKNHDEKQDVWLLPALAAPIKPTGNSNRLKTRYSQRIHSKPTKNNQKPVSAPWFPRFDALFSASPPTFEGSENKRCNRGGKPEDKQRWASYSISNSVVH
jgi:hypothetical protein